ncbi:MAG: diaminopimelate decarboxylase [bacterium]|nr:diaminopimelate decarboxylase [bacterium]
MNPLAQQLLGGRDPGDLARRFGTPLYLYDEAVLRRNASALAQLVPLDNFRVYYSAKANSNVSLLQIIRQEGLGVDALSAGEVLAEEAAGYKTPEILFVSNNVPQKTFDWMVQKGIRHCCVDSLGQMRRWLKAQQGGKVTLRLNPAQGAGHHEKVITAGKVKFGIEPELLDQAILEAQQLGGQVNGLMIHIGSLFLQAEPWLEAVDWLLGWAEKYPQIDYIDFGGGLGLPYDRSQEGEFPLADFGQALHQKLNQWMERNGRRPTFAIEPGRFVVAESGLCLVEVQSVKTNQGIRFVGTDLGFNFLIRPEMYGSFHQILHATKTGEGPPVMVVGNVCESGDYLGKDRPLPDCEEGDLLLVRDTGAYGFSMASNYNSMGRPAEVLLETSGGERLIRRREEPDVLLGPQIYGP